VLLEGIKKLNYPVGDNTFEGLITRDIFVDKSLFIKQILTDSSKNILITRFRRSGKTLNM